MGRSVGRQAAKLGGAGVPDLNVVAVSGANADTEIAVAGLKLNDVIVSVIDLTDGTSLAPKTAGHETITIGSSTSGDKLLVVFWSVGLGGNPTNS